MGGRAVWRIGVWFAIPAVLSAYPPIRLTAQSRHAANPERPSVATHAYTVAPGYMELEQGVRAQGFGNFRDQTSWEFNLKIGVARPVQLCLFGTGYNRTGEGNGVGDVGVALKLRRDLSSTHTVALVPAVTLVVDGGGVVGLGPSGRDQLFLGVTTNLGRIFKSQTPLTRVPRAR